MRAFRNGEREFKPGELVYFIDADDKIKWGTVDSYCGNGVYDILMYYIKECRLIDGVPIKEVDLKAEHPLPKKWTYDTKLFEESYSSDYPEVREFCRNLRIDQKEKLLEGIEKDFLVPWDQIFDGYLTTEVDRKTWHFRRESQGMKSKGERAYKDLIFRDYPLAQAKRDSIIAEKKAENDRILTMTEEEYNQYEKEREQKRKLAAPKEEYHPEKYLVIVHYSWDADCVPLLRKYTDEDPQVYFEQYSDPREYALTVANKQWTLEKGLEKPVRYVNGFMDGGERGVIPTLASQYVFPKGNFDIVEGKLRSFDISLTNKVGITNFGITVVGGTKRSEEDIKEFCGKKVKEIMGGFSSLFLGWLKNAEVRYY